eukprot:XP_001698060.1 predicted protein [Chlamydomonas reinhardtii]
MHRKASLLGATPGVNSQLGRGSMGEPSSNGSNGGNGPNGPLSASPAELQQHVVRRVSTFAEDALRRSADPTAALGGVSDDVPFGTHDMDRASSSLWSPDDGGPGGHGGHGPASAGVRDSLLPDVTLSQAQLNARMSLGLVYLDSPKGRISLNGIPTVGTGGGHGELPPTNMGGLEGGGRAAGSHAAFLQHYAAAAGSGDWSAGGSNSGPVAGLGSAGAPSSPNVSFYTPGSGPASAAGLPARSSSFGNKDGGRFSNLQRAATTSLLTSPGASASLLRSRHGASSFRELSQGLPSPSTPVSAPAVTGSDLYPELPTRTFKEGPGVTSPAGAGHAGGVASPQHHAALPANGLVWIWQDVPKAMRAGTWAMAEYTITRQLHNGYASCVYKATCHRSGQDVVLKAYTLSSLSDFLRNQMLRELDIHARLQHPAVVQILGAFREGDLLVIVLEYVRGGSLDRARRKLGGRMTEQQALELVMAPLLRTLHYLHTQTIVHRDIKPANLLFTPDWKLKVCDYGVSICLGEERAVTRTGSRDYMAPEVNVCPLKRTPADNKENPQMAYGAAVDVWSVGALAYELLVGFTPFPGGPPATRKGDPTKSLVFPSSVSNDARNFVLSCLEQAPGDRPTVQQLLRHRWLQGASGGADRSTAVKQEP